jgi:hypothetical protein
MNTALGARFPGAVVGEVRVGPISDGTNSRAVVHLGFASGSGPARVFVKREGPVLHRLALAALGALTSEVRLAASGTALPVERPAPYAAAFDRRRLAAIVVMEDVTLRAGRPNGATNPLTIGQVRSGLRGLARLHAQYWDRPLPEALGFLRPWRLRTVWAPVSFASLSRALHVLGVRGRAGLLPPGADAASLERSFRRWAALAATGPQTVLHGDPHPANTYALADETIGFYDWQLVRTGHWSHDVGYFIVSSLDIEARRAHEHLLLEGYLEEVRSAGVRAPAFDDAWRRYRQTPAYGLGAWLHTLSGGRFQPVDDSLTAVGRFGAAYADHHSGTTDP